ncbi:MarR family winged helix-turn-helix transcriptional regulator [Leifsonia sp. EB34]|uniref:MarR family winged helix-turn-helix transcriptional regulator n=1 Tax=Leifsonia sp. EB34 TaxID=3156303 RepID=UPI00351694BA
MPDPSASSVRAALDLRVAFARLRRRLREVASEPAGLSAQQSSALARIGKGEASTASRLAELEGVRPQSMATTIASLEELGLVVRTPDPTDGRRQLVSLTDAGREAESGNLDARREWLAHAMEERLTEEERQTVLAATALIEKLVRP